MSGIITPAASVPRIWNPEMPGSLRSGLVFAGGMEFPGSTYYHDASGLGNHGTLTNMDPATDWVWDSWLQKWVLDFDGSNDYVDFSSLQFQFSVGDWTVSAWIKAAAGIAQYDTAWGQCDNGGFGVRLWTRDSSAHKWSWETYGSTTRVESLAAIEVGVWHQVTCGILGGTRGTISLWIDGVAQNTRASASVAIGDVFQIGRHGTMARYFPMQLAGFTVHNRTLTPPEIEWLAQPQHKLWVPWRRTVWPVASVTDSTQYNITKINSIPILSIGKINSNLLSGVKRVMGVNVQTT